VRDDPLVIDATGEQRKGRIIGVCTAGTAIVVIVLTLVSFSYQHRLFADTTAPLTIQVTGNQWWWKVRYQGDRPDRQLETANEIHIPVESPVRLLLETSDVIHSFWVPSLAGKMDQITGQQNALRLNASRAGVYRGQCAEFCGKQHAHMAMLVIAVAPAEFSAWWDAQLQPAAAPSDAESQQGMQAFFVRGCMLCHAIRGTHAAGIMGPDLTHFASRRTIAAGTLPNTPGNLGGWIADPQHVKPGAQMPLMDVDGRELNALVAYLMGLR
jgi:cytochrome c oxidase subunit 2